MTKGYLDSNEGLSQRFRNSNLGKEPHVPQPREPRNHVTFGFPLTGEKEVKEWPLPFLPAPTFALLLVRHSLEDPVEQMWGWAPPLLSNHYQTKEHY